MPSIILNTSVYSAATDLGPPGPECTPPIVVHLNLSRAGQVALCDIYAVCQWVASEAIRMKLPRPIGLTPRDVMVKELFISGVYARLVLELPRHLAADYTPRSFQHRGFCPGTPLDPSEPLTGIDLALGLPADAFGRLLYHAEES